MTLPQTLQSDVTLYFVRHGETDWNRARRLQGQIDIPINELGRTQARRNGEVLGETLGAEALSRLNFVASPLSRTRETMEIVRQAAGLLPGAYETDPRLMEIKYGTWEGAYLDELKRGDPDAFRERRENKFGWRPANGESYRDLTERVRHWLSGITRDTVVVSHGGVSRVVRGLIMPIAEDEIPVQIVPQDKIMICRHGSFDWL